MNAPRVIRVMHRMRASLGSNHNDAFSINDACTEGHSMYVVFAQLSSKIKYVVVSLDLTFKQS